MKKITIIHSIFIIIVISAFLLGNKPPLREYSDVYDQIHINDTVKATFDGKNLWWFYDEDGKLNLSDETLLFFTNWKNDTNRTDTVFGFRYKNYDIFNGGTFLCGLKRSDVINYLGKDNSRNKNETGDIKHNLEFLCYMENADCCWLDILFNDKEIVVLSMVICT